MLPAAVVVPCKGNDVLLAAVMKVLAAVMKVLAVNTFVAAILVVTVLFETLLVVVMVRVVAALPQKVVMTEAFLPTVSQIGSPTWRGNNNK